MTSLYRIRTNFSGGALLGAGSATHHFLAPDLTAADAVEALRTFWTSVGAWMTSGIQWIVDPAIDIIESTTNELTDAASYVSAGGSGSDSSGFAPLVVQGLIQWRTGAVVGGKELRGRTFIPGVPKGVITSTGAPAGTYTEALDVAAEALIDDADSVLVLYSPTHFEYAEVVNSTVWTKFAELRSRRD